MLDKLLDVLKLSGLLDSLKGYIDSKIRLYTLRLENRVARVITGILMMVAFLGCLFIGFIFLGVGLSIVLNRWIGSPSAGFFITGGIFVLMMIWFAVNIDGGSLHEYVRIRIKDLINRDDD